MATARPTIPLSGQPSIAGRMEERDQTVWWQEFIWVGSAGILGFGVTAIFAGWLELPRPWLVLVYASLAMPLVGGYVRWANLDIARLVRHHWLWGVVGAVAISAFLIVSVANQDSSARPTGLALVGDILWLGIVYGLVDALLLSVLPVIATWRALTQRGWTAHWPGRIAAGFAAVAASALVAAAYHLGYPEFRGADLGNPIVGNAIMSIGYVLTQNPITAIISHIVMHIAAVFHGADTTVQLPPHY